MKRLGLIVNPVAGLGGRVGLKGSDGEAIQLLAKAKGATPQAGERARRALEGIKNNRKNIQLVTASGAMGELPARQAGFEPLVIDHQAIPPTGAHDTIRVAQLMAGSGVDLILFAGGDGTASDISQAVGLKVPVLGIPAGVKMQSGVFAINPWVAGETVTAFLEGGNVQLKEAEVVDLDEMSYRHGSIDVCLQGYLKVPYLSNRTQNRKAPTPDSETVRAQAIAVHVVESMPAGWLTILGPGTTTRAVAEQRDWPKTLLGIDIYDNETGPVLLDANEQGILQTLTDRPAKLVLSPTGGQGFMLGRGNQQISPEVLHKVGRENLVIISLIEKLIGLHGAPLRVDLGNCETERWLSGYRKVIIGYHQTVIYKME